MKKLPKEILNYFATFTETRFNFRRLINYKWTNDECTLDLSLFPDFQNHLLEKIRSGDLAPVSIKNGQHSIYIPEEEIAVEIEKLLRETFHEEYVEQCIKDEYEDILSQSSLFISGENGDLLLAEDSPDGHKLLNKQKEIARKEGLRKYNLTLRREFENVLVNLQKKIVEQKQEELNIKYVPSSIFGVNAYVNQHFDQIKKIAVKYTDSESYISSIAKYFSESIKDIPIYDLFYNLQKYANYMNLGTLFIFFHMLEQNEEAYPLYFLEAECRTSNTEVILSFPRQLMILNTPAINYFKFNDVLTEPRASSILSANNHLETIEMFLQTQYGVQNPFLLQPAFNTITHSEEKYPDIKSRIGLQVIRNEDKKLLDYSELMTKTELGESTKFPGFIDQYIQGTVPNFQDEVDQSFKQDYSIKSPKRYVSDGPIPVNTSQRRILLALAKPKNKVIVVDGPPGTGKSHAIAALTYWANEQNKSMVITSHKQEALDVIDRMLTDKYKSLHPQAKPSIVRMDKETGSANNLQNTLQAAVLGAANQRALDYNIEAVKKDEARLSEKVISKIEDKLGTPERYEEILRNTIEFEILDRELGHENPEVAEVFSILGLPQEDIDFKKIGDFLTSGFLERIQNISLEEYAYVLEHKHVIPDFLEACEKLHQIPEQDQSLDTPLQKIPEDFLGFLSELQDHFRQDVQISRLEIKHSTAGMVKKIFGKAPDPKKLESLISTISSLQHANIISEISRLLGVSKDELTLKDLSTGIEKLQSLISLRKHKLLISAYRDLPGNAEKKIDEIYNTFGLYQEMNGLMEELTYQNLRSLFSHYGNLLNTMGISRDGLDSLMKLERGHDETTGKLWKWIQLHYMLSTNMISDSVTWEDLEAYSRLKQKNLEYINDTRLKDMNNHLGEMERIKVSYEGNKRFSLEETRVLLNCISCVIAEPGSISRFFPMEEDLIDILVIDEASQVSIADSISLILRAKQVVIFGDEYQYGAVSATNVNAKYSASYFRRILSAYSDDYSATISDSAQEELIGEVSKDVPADEQESDMLLKPQEGTVLWLKTFNIRTSTLAFAKAIANYTTSLREHFRSFPEIISYSNDFFYKVAQLELVVNRIRTKPIGEVLQFVHVDTKGKAAPNTNLDEIEVIAGDIQIRLDAGYKGTIGIITSFREQQVRMEQILNERFNMSKLRNDHKLAIWFVGDVQGEERDLVYYSFVEDKGLGNANLVTIYPVVGGSADNIRSLKMQRLNVGFSRAKDTMVFVHSQSIDQFSNTRLGDALKHYWNMLETNRKNDFFVEDESVFDSPMEKKLYSLLLETSFVKKNREHIKIIPQFDIGKYIAGQYAVSIPKYRTDFLLTLTEFGKERALILEYDGLEYHFKNPQEVNNLNFSQEYLDYDVSRQLELESYGYRFLRINKFNLRPQSNDQTEVDVLNTLLERKFLNNV